jgi:PEP-CTERM motif-containing protein
MIRKSLWMIPVVLLFTALGSTAAHADTIVTSGGNVTGIDGITIAGTTYNVTWGTVIDTTFAASLTNATAMNNAIAADLSAYGTPSVSDSFSTSVVQVGVDGGGILSPIAFMTTPTQWTPSSSPTVDWTTTVATQAQNSAWDEFAVVTTPEPGTAALMLTGLALLGMVVLRSRVALRHP